MEKNEHNDLLKQKKEIEVRLNKDKADYRDVAFKLRENADKVKKCIEIILNQEDVKIVSRIKKEDYLSFIQNLIEAFKNGAISVDAELEWDLIDNIKIESDSLIKENKKIKGVK